MEHAFLYLIAGMIGGFCSSAPIGPINLWVADAVLQNRTQPLTRFLAGVIVCDMIYAAFAAWGYYSWLADETLKSAFHWVGGIFLIGLGIFGIFKNKDQKINQSEGKTSWRDSTLANFFAGFVMTGSNPAFLLFWVAAIDVINRTISAHPSPVAIAAFLLGIGLGDGIWFRALAALVKKGGAKLNPKLLGHFRLLIAAVFIGIGVMAIVQNFD
jgi:threonine/homoserine/homoserine lactone efflux protein